MCGIVGFYGQMRGKKNVIKKMASLINHRGPDGEGYYVDDVVALGHKRLAIVDISLGSQPMFYENLVVIFNGEIYNYQSLRLELEKSGYVFKTNSDTEVLLYGYLLWKEDLCLKLRGMFAFVIYDKRSKVFFGARDNFGMKPLYYYYKNDIFMFASEIKAFLGHPKFVKVLNESALKMFLIFQYSVKNETFFKDVFKLEPGHYFIYDGHSLVINSYFDISLKSKKSNFRKAKRDLEKVINESICLHKSLSDVSVGSYLSGGVDSSYVACLARPSKTFSVGFDYDGFDETHYAKDLANLLGLENYSRFISADDFFASLPLVMYYTDEPHANLTSVPLYYLSKLTSDYVKVVLSGEGADELFVGYNEYCESFLIRLYLLLPLVFRKFVRNVCFRLPRFKGRNSLIRYGQDFADRYVGHGSYMESDEANELLAKRLRSNEKISDVLNPYLKVVKDSSDLIKKRYLDFHFWLANDILLKADKMSMANSVELRTPLLDIEIYNYVHNLPNRYFLRGKKTKYLFRLISKKYLPNSWAKRRKCGFPVPFSKWIRIEKYYNNVKEYFNKSYVSDFFDKCFINRLLDEHYSKKANNGRKIYNIYCFLVWYDVYFGN